MRYYNRIVSKKYALIISVGILIIFILTGCDFLSGFFSKQDEKVATYETYKKAVQAGDIETLKKLLVKEKVAALEADNAPEMVELMKSFYPPESNIRGIEVKGDSAVIALTAPAEGASMHGRVTMVKEDGSWKIKEEHWEMKVSRDSTQPVSPPDSGVARPYFYPMLTGIWKGAEAGHSGGEWEFTFGNNYIVSVKGPHGEAYRGDARLHKELGEVGGGIRVLHGGSLFDMEIIEAPDSWHIGKISLGSYKLSGDILRFCSGEPGLIKRTSDFGTAGGIRCFELRRVQ